MIYVTTVLLEWFGWLIKDRESFSVLRFPGATSAPCLIFIFPAVFYIRIVPKEEEPLRSFPKILVSILREIEN